MRGWILHDDILSWRRLRRDGLSGRNDGAMDGGDICRECDESGKGQDRGMDARCGSGIEVRLEMEGVGAGPAVNGGGGRDVWGGGTSGWQRNLKNVK